MRTTSRRAAPARLPTATRRTVVGLSVGLGNTHGLLGLSETGRGDDLHRLRVGVIASARAVRAGAEGGTVSTSPLSYLRRAPSTGATARSQHTLPSARPEASGAGIVEDRRLETRTLCGRSAAEAPSNSGERALQTVLATTQPPSLNTRLRCHLSGASYRRALSRESPLERFDCWKDLQGA
jgi:hypothetical protein